MIKRASALFGHTNPIDSLRGAAVLAVVLMHAKGFLWIGISETWAKNGFAFNLSAWLGYISAPTMFGYLGVPLFFVLSGYCIHFKGAHRLAKNPSARMDIKNYSVRRIVRIYPTYCAVLLLTALIDVVLIADHLKLTGEKPDNSLFAFIANLVSMQGIVAPVFGSNGVLWTLSIEIHLYAVYPILFAVSRKFGAHSALAFTLVVSTTYIFVDDFFRVRDSLPSNFGIGPVFLSYWFTWTAGFFLAEAKASRVRLPLGFPTFALLSALLGSALILWNRFSEIQSNGGFLYDLSETILVAITFAGLVYWSTAGSGVGHFRGVLGNSLAKIGVFSYSLYAIHVPVLLLLKSTFVASGIAFDSLLPALIGVICALLSALLLFLVVEQWSLRS